MGILDQYLGDTDMQSPQNQQMMSIAAALLQAGGPSRTPVSFGQAFGNAMQAGQQAYQSAEDRALLRQMKNEDLNLKKQAEKRAQQTLDQQNLFFKKLSGTDQVDYGNQRQAQQMPQSIQQPLKLGMSADGNMGFQSQPNIQVPAPQQSQMQQRPQSGGIQNLSLDDLGMAAVAGIPGAKELLDIKKFQLNGIKRDNATYIDPVTNKQTYFADPTKGLDYNPETKTVSNLNGFNQANAAMKGAETFAQEQAKAQFNPMIVNGVDEFGRSRPEQTTVADFVQQRSGMQQPQQGQAPQGQQVQPQQAPNGQQAGPQGLDVSRLTPQQIQALQRRDPEAFYNGMNDFAQTRGQSPAQGMQQPQAAPQQQFAPQPQQALNQPRFGIPLQSEAQKAEELANVKLRTEPALEQQTGTIKGKQGTLNASNENWIKQRYNPALEAGDKAKDVAASLDTLANVDFKTGWGSEAKIKGVSILVGLGMAPKNAEFYVGNGQVFQNEVMKQLVSTFEGQKGTQTEGDAKRVQQTFAQLANTPYANQYIADLARAKANRDARKAAFYQDAYPIALQTGDLTEVDRRWMKLQGSIWNDPVLQKYKGAK